MTDMKRFNTNMVVITKDNQWFRMGECCICLITDEEYEKLTKGVSPHSINTVAQMTLRGINHMDVGALIF